MEKEPPNDGKINWNWQKERIYNWVRAQADPYPGAFCYLNDKKIRIDKISFCDDGFKSDTPNGTILSFEPFKVKTCNGVIQIDKHRENLVFDSKHKYITRMKIADYNINNDSPCFIIAELSANHNGCFETALETVRAAKRQELIVSNYKHTPQTH